MNFEIDPEVRSYIFAKLKGEYPEKTINLQIRELERFIFIASLNPGNSRMRLPISSEIDRVWHYLILHTRRYREYCSRIKPKFFLNHNPLGSEPLIEPNINDNLFYIVRYVHFYKKLEKNILIYWPIANSLYSLSKLNISDFNKYLRGINELENSNMDLTI